MARAGQPKPLTPQEQKGKALEAILDVWDHCLKHGVSPEYLASSAIFAALTEMVDLHGEDAVAEFCAELPERVRMGEFTFQEPQ